MMRILMCVLVLAPRQEESVLRPAEPKVQWQEQQWIIALSLQADLPDETVVQIHVRPVVLHFAETRKVLEWEESESAKPPRLALLRRKRADLRLALPALRRLAVTYSVDPKGQTRGAVIRREVPPVRCTYLPGPASSRLKLLRDEYEKPAKSQARLLEILKQLEQTEKSSNPERTIAAVVAALGEFRDRCAKESSEGAFPATAGFLDSVAGDAATYCSWLAQSRRKPASKGSGDGSGSNNVDPTEADGFKGDGSGGGGSSGPGSKGRPDNRNIRNDSAAGHRKRLECVPALHRAETLLILDMETLALLDRAAAGTPPSAEEVSGLRATIELVEQKLARDRIPAEAVAHLRDAAAALVSGSAEDATKARDGVMKHQDSAGRLP